MTRATVLVGMMVVATRGLVGDARAENLVEAFAAEKIDLDLFEKNLGRLGKAPGASPGSDVRER